MNKKKEKIDKKADNKLQSKELGPTFKKRK